MCAQRRRRSPSPSQSTRPLPSACSKVDDHWRQQYSKCRKDNGVFTLHGRELPLQGLKSLVACALRMIMVQKFQTPQQVEQALFAVDKLRRNVLAYNETLLREATEELWERNPDAGTL
eukprot:41091-Amphidinium_carterae.1